MKNPEEYLKGIIVLADEKEKHEAAIKQAQIDAIKECIRLARDTLSNDCLEYIDSHDYSAGTEHGENLEKTFLLEYFDNLLNEIK
jgi:hypothetical protein